MCLPLLHLGLDHILIIDETEKELFHGMALIFELIKLIQSLLVGFRVPDELVGRDDFTLLYSFELFFLLLLFVIGQLRTLHNVLSVATPLARSDRKL